MENWIIQKIEKKDNQAIAQLIRAVFDELNIPEIGNSLCRSIFGFDVRGIQ